MVVCLRWLSHHLWSVSYTYIYITGKLGFVSFMCANNRIHCDPMVLFVCVYITLIHYRNYADLYEGIEYIELKCLCGTFCLEWMSKIKTILSIIFHAIYGAVRIQLTHFSYDDCENMCTLSCHHHQYGSMTFLPLFRTGSWFSGVLCMPFYILMIYAPDYISKCCTSSQFPIRIN